MRNGKQHTQHLRLLWWVARQTFPSHVLIATSKENVGYLYGLTRKYEIPGFRWDIENNRLLHTNGTCIRYKKLVSRWVHG